MPASIAASERDEEEEFNRQNVEELKPPEDGSAGNEQSKLKQLMNILKKTVGVSDLASLRLSLPANLIHPEPNLEYWQYADRPDLFAAMADSQDSAERMKAVIRWFFSKDLKFVKGKVCKPYNSVLGEQFRSIWDVEPASVDSSTGDVFFSEYLDPAGASSADSLPPSAPSSRPASIRSIPPSPKPSSLYTSSVAASSSSVNSAGKDSTPATSTQSVAQPSSATPGDLQKADHKARVVFLNEQVSHHPPVSTFWLESVPASSSGQRVIAMGADQLSAKFTGTSVKVYAGEQNKGIFVMMPDRNDEEYNCTHPTASITGILRGNPYITISEHAYITQRIKGSNKGLRAIISYPDESWIGKAKFALEGVVYEYEAGTESETYTKIKHVPEKLIRAQVEGSWRGVISWRAPGKKTESTTLIDLRAILPIPKTVRPISAQTETESRRLWRVVTEAITNKKFQAATKEKQAIEQAQRDLAAERKSKGIKHVPVLFDDEARLEAADGRARLSDKGREVLQQEIKGVAYA